ncbi:hypothetical protein FOCC_FOCC007327 [Frankliniella occidentalis]|nr:hypothetical protein FOCC_FOCC007327 [Frankliniella occidentalis]
MRHNNKVALTAKFKSEVDEEDNILFEVPDVDAPARTSLPTNYAVDGGHLLHSVAWTRPEEKGRGGKSPAKTYVEHVTKKYGSEPTIVFDGYGVAWSTKLEEQRRRSPARKFCPNFNVEEKNVVPSGHPKEDSLANNEVVVSPPKFHSWSTASKRNIVAILVARAGSDTGITVARPGKDAFNIRAIRKHLIPKNMLDCVLVGHAFSGCDTTSAIYKKGKTKLWTNLEESNWCSLKSLIHCAHIKHLRTVCILFQAKLEPTGNRVCKHLPALFVVISVLIFQQERDKLI